MTIKFLKHVKKYVATYHGQAVAVGNNLPDTIAEAVLVIAKTTERRLGTL